MGFGDRGDKVLTHFLIAFCGLFRFFCRLQLKTSSCKNGFQAFDFFNGFRVFGNISLEILLLFLQSFQFPAKFCSASNIIFYVLDLSF